MYFLFVLLAILILSVMIGRRMTGVENFKIATEGQVEAGSSGAYRWGYTPITPKETTETETTSWEYDWSWKKKKKPKHKCPKCGDVFFVDVDVELSGCHGCDITKHPDIDKYVLKSSVPPCPDMSQYVKKDEMCPCVDMSQYVRKSALEPRGTSYDSFYESDSRYMLKTDCASHSFTPTDDYSSWLSGGKGGQWYADRNNTNWPPKLNTTGTTPLAYNSIGEIV